MKNLLKLVLLLCAFANVFSVQAQEGALDENYFQLSPRVGYDFPTYKNNTPHIDYKGGMDFGISLDYYWNWFGVGVDFDYIKNSPESTFSTSNLYEADGKMPINTFSLTEDHITRMFYGIGPNAQYRASSGKFTAELNTRIGMASINGGRTYLEGASVTPNSFPLNFHAGYKDSGVLSFKGQLRFTYFITQKIGLNLGAYYMQHFGVQELNESGISAQYQVFTADASDTVNPKNILDGGPMVRNEACDCDISSIGVFAGLTYKFTKSKKVDANICPVCKEDHLPHCCATCGCLVSITARDKFTGELLPETEITLIDLNGNVAYSGITNELGVAVFDDVATDNYIISGKLYGVALEDEIFTKEDFKNCQRDINGLQKTMVYTDDRFILKGKVVECNLEKGIENVDIILTDKDSEIQTTTISDSLGNFMFHLKKASNFVLNGRKDGYYSNAVAVSTNEHKRENNLFIDLEMCVDPCGKTINLDNINFDLNQSEILPASYPDLDRIVKLMNEIPNIRVEMSSHTDSQGSDEYNKQLSQRRADATVKYIVKQGISKDRLTAKGAGETELKNTKCVNNVPCTDEEHRVNRRTEFKVFCF